MANKELQIGFRLSGIQEKQFSMFPDVEVANKEITQNIRFRFGSELSNRLIACGCIYSLAVEKNLFLHIEVICQFQIEEESWNEIFHKEKGRVILGNSLAEHLASIVVSTARGILFANTKNTEFSKYPLNLINVHEILNGKDIEIKS